MVKNKTRQKPANAWVSLCLVTKRLANWGELLSEGSEVQILPETDFKKQELSAKKANNLLLLHFFKILYLS